MTLKNLLDNLKKRGLRDILNPVRWYRVYQAWQAEKHTSLEYIEQVVWRQTICGPCVKANNCTHCGCAAKKVILVPEEACSGGHWGPMMPAVEWADYKEQMGLEFQINLNPVPRIKS